MAIEIRQVTTQAEREAVYRLRYDIYVDELGFKWGGTDHVNRWLPDPPGPPSQILYAADGDRVIGTLRMQLGSEGGFGPDDHAVYQPERFTSVVPLERMAILTRYMTRAEYRDTSTPADLLDAGIQLLLDNGMQVLFCDCRPHLINTYIRLGFRPYAKTYNDPVAGLLVPLVMVLDDVEHFRRVGSRLAGLVEGRKLDLEVPAKMAALIPSAGPVSTVTDVSTWQDWIDVLPVVSDSTDDEIQIFEGISPEEIARIISMSNVISCARGDRIIAQDQADHSMFILLQGTAEVIRGEELVAVLPRGSIFGEISFLLKRGRTADVFAASDDVEILCLRGKNLSELIRSESSVAARLLYNLSRIMAERLASAD